MTRRDLLIGSALNGGALTMQSTAPLGIGFLGASHSHASGKLVAALANPNLRVVGGCDDTPAGVALLKKLGVKRLTRTELLSHSGIAVVAVESAVRDHAADGLAVIESGKHLHLEKAPAVHKGELEAIVAAAARRRRLIQVGYMWRYNPAVEKALEAARQGWLGKVYMVRASIGNQLAAARRAEWSEFSGGVMFELGGHVIDPLVRLLGKPLKVTPRLRNDGGIGDQFNDNTAAVFEWEHAMGIVQAQSLQTSSGRYRSIEIFGTNGCAIVNPIEAPTLSIDLASAAGSYVAGVQRPAFAKYERYVGDLVELVAAIRGEVSLRVSPTEELAVQDALLRASGMD